MKLIMDMGFAALNTRIRQCLVANPPSCTGCRTCEAVCSLIKTGHIFLDGARLRIDRDPFEGRFVPQVCHQCSTPYCMSTCPKEAIGISEKDGTVLIDKEKCDGCALCRKACPFGMIRIDDEQKKAFKCDLCGGIPNASKHAP